MLDRCFPADSRSAAASENPTASSGDRVRSIDVARALGVIGVILGHAWYGSAAERIALSFDLPLFFFVGGYVYSEKYSERPSLAVVKRLRTLYFPFVRWGLFWLLLHNVLYEVGIYSSLTGYLDQPSRWYTWRDFVDASLRIVTFRGTEPMAGALWFLASLYLTNIFFALTSFAVLKMVGRPQEWVRAGMIGGLAAVGYLSNPLLGNRMYLGTSLVALLVFYGGVIYRRCRGYVPLRWELAAVMAVIVVAGNGGVYFGANSYRHPLLLLTVVPAGIYMCLWLSEKLQHNRFLQYVGTNTIFIIATHFLAFKAVSLIQMRVNGYPSYFLAKYPVITGENGWWVAYFVCGLFLPAGLKLAIDWLLRTIRAGRRSDLTPS
ncbi:MAG: acyltransferase family protein [Verrucomicrobiota bacterium]